MELLHLYESSDIKVSRWKGWLEYPDNTLQLSQEHQGNGDLSNLPKSSAIALVKCELMQAHTVWEESPEVENANLLFCIETDT